MARRPRKLFSWTTWTFAARFAVFLLAPALSLAQDATGEAGANWKTGVPFRRQLESPVSLKWKENPLREGLGRLAEAQGTALLLDRRIDPDQRVDFACSDEALEVAILRLCREIDAGMTCVGPVIYIGPKESASTLATVAALRRQEAAELPNDAKGRWLRQQAIRWPLLAQPRDLIATLAEQGRFNVENPDAIPHDLWPAVSLPPLALADRLSLVLAGFGLTYQMSANGTSVTLVPLPATAVYEHAYTTRGDAGKLLAQLKEFFPDAQIERRSNQIAVAAPYETHEKIERLLRGERVKSVQAAGGEKRYSLKVENQPAGAVIKAIAKELGKEMKFDPAALDALKKNVNFTVKDVPLEELLRTTLEPLGLKWKVTEEAIEIYDL